MACSSVLEDSCRSLVKLSKECSTCGALNNVRFETKVGQTRAGKGQAGKEAASDQLFVHTSRIDSDLSSCNIISLQTTTPW